MKLVTVVIPCFNSGLTLGQTVESVRAQTYPNLEIIVVDDGSSDPLTIRVIDRLVGVRVIRQDNAGLPAARNKGFSNARGEYVLPLDSDDWLESDAIAHMAEALAVNPSLAFVFSNIKLEGEAGGVLRKSYNFFEQLFLNQIPYALLLRRSVWKTVGGYDEAMRGGYEDWEFNIRLGARGYFGAPVQKILFHYRVASTGMLLSKSNHLHGDLWKYIQRKNRCLYGIKNLVNLWLHWRKKNSTYPLILYFLWLFVHRVFPRNLFNFLFRSLRKHSQSHRVTKQASRAAMLDSAKVSEGDLGGSKKPRGP